MTVTNNSNADLKHKINNATHIFDQFTTRNTQLERKKERLAREFVTQNSQLESIETQIKLVKENYAEPQMDTLANELSILNESLVNHERIESPLKSEQKNNENNLATLMADETRVKSERNTSQHEHSTLNQEKYTLAVSYTHLTLPTNREV